MRFVLPQPFEKFFFGRSSIVNRIWYDCFASLYYYLGFGEFEVYGGDFCGAHAMVDPGLTWTNGLAELPDAEDNSLQGVFQLPNNYKNNTDIYLFAVIEPSDTSTNSVVLNYNASTGDYETATAWSGSDTSTLAMPGVANQPTKQDLGTIDGSGLVKNGLIGFEIGRTGTDGDDDYAATAYLVGVGIKYQIEGIGFEKTHPGGS